MTQKQALDRIYNDLQAGKTYGKDFLNVRYPFFDTCLFLTSRGNIGYRHYGESAVKNTKKALAWTITVIFKLSPVDFLKVYYRNTESVCKY